MIVNDKLYKSVCEKLGFDPFYEPLETITDATEDDRDRENPMLVLTEEELDYFIEKRIMIAKELQAAQQKNI